MKKKLCSIILVFVIPAFLMGAAPYYSKEQKEEMSAWIGIGTVKKIEFVENKETEIVPNVRISFSEWKVTFLIHKVIKEDESRIIKESIEFNYCTGSGIVCPPQPSIKIGDKGKLYLGKGEESYCLFGKDFFIKVKDLENLPDTLSEEEPRSSRDWKNGARECGKNTSKDADI